MWITLKYNDRIWRPSWSMAGQSCHHNFSKLVFCRICHTQLKLFTTVTSSSASWVFGFHPRAIRSPSHFIKHYVFCPTAMESYYIISIAGVMPMVHQDITSCLRKKLKRHPNFVKHSPVFLLAVHTNCLTYICSWTKHCAAVSKCKVNSVNWVN